MRLVVSAVSLVVLVHVGRLTTNSATQTGASFDSVVQPVRFAIDGPLIAREPPAHWSALTKHSWGGR